MRRIRIVVADQCNARFFDALEHGPLMQDAGTLADADGRKHEQDLVTDRAGSGVSGGHGHYALDHRSSRKEHEVEMFAKRIAVRLHSDFDKGAFDEIALVAAPRFLGALRKALPPALHAKVLHEVHHDLVHQTEKVIREHLPVRWPEPHRA